MIHLVLTLTTLWLCQPTPVAPSAAIPAASVPTKEDLSALGIDELIKRLPPAGGEWRWNHATSNGVEDPASLEMAKRVIKGGFTDDQSRAALLATGAIRLRSAWPKNEPYAVSLTPPRWLGLTRIRLKPRAEGMEGIEAGELFWSFSGTFPAIHARDARLGRPMGLIPADAKQLTFDIEVERGDSRGFGMEDDDGAKRPAPGILWKGQITTPIQLVDSFEQAIPAVRGPELDRAVRHAIGAGIREWGGKNEKFPFVLADPDCTKFPVLSTTALTMKVELLDQGKVVGESRLIALDADTMTLMNSVSMSSKRFFGSTNIKPAFEAMDTAGWSIRLTGGSHHLRYMWEAKTRWDGEITIPWADAVRNEAERTGPDGRGPECSTPFAR